MRLLALLALTAGAAEDVAPVRALLHRLLPAEVADSFELRLDAKQPAAASVAPCPESSAETCKTALLSGSDVPSLARAVGVYLQEVANVGSMTWDNYADLSDLPSELSEFPRPKGTLVRTREVDETYAWNVCTYGYSFAWYDQARWARLVDWMALEGVTLPLAFLGQERVLIDMFVEDFGFAEDEVRTEFISGVAFLPWFRMGNMQVWGGPETDDFFTQRAKLNAFVLERMIELGMNPVLPGFAGFVPPSFTKHFPQAKVQASADWNGMPGKTGSVLHLDPTDPLFKKIGAAFVKRYRETFAAALARQPVPHYYNCDTFNEMEPPSADAKYLSGASQAVVDGMKAADEHAIWLMQGWLFLDTKFWTQDRIHAYLSPIPVGDLVVLDLATDQAPQWQRSENYAGHKFLANLLLNYGGKQGIAGDAKQFDSAVSAIEADASAKPLLAGVGVTPEGIYTNFMLFEQALQRAWGAKNPEFAEQFAARRYGPHAVAQAELYKTYYAKLFSDESQNGYSARFATVPTFEKAVPSAQLPQLAQTTLSFWRELVGAGRVDHTNWEFDVVDFGRQTLGAEFDRYYLSEYLVSVEAGDLSKMAEKAAYLEQLLDDIDLFLGSSEHFLLGPWLNEARAWGSGDAKLQAHFESQARFQITLWGPTGQIEDYARKHWSGLTRGYYKPRWQLFFKQVEDAVKNKKPFDQGAFRAAEQAEVGQKFVARTQEQDKYEAKKFSDAFEMSKALLQKYFPAGLDEIHI